MKVGSLVLLMIGCVALTCGFGAPYRPVPQERSSVGRSSTTGQDPIYHLNGRLARRTSTETRNRIPLPKKREHFAPEHLADVPGVGAEKPAGAAKVGLNQRETAPKAPVVFRPPAAIASGVPSSGAVRHRHLNAAIVGGSTISNNKNAGVLNGSRINRKP